MSTQEATLPDLSNPFELAPSAHQEYLKQGHAVVRGLASREEAAAYLPHIADALEKNKKEHRKLEERGTYHKAFIQVGNLWELSAKVKKFVFARRFAKVAADLMGVDGVRVYHDQALFKEPGGGPTPWHQDQFYWPIDTDKTITMWMPLCDCPLEMGSLVFASGQHTHGAFAQLAISDESAQTFSGLAKEKEWPLRIYELGMGDATFHAGWTPHKAPGNSTDRMRPAMTIIYHAHDARISEMANSAQPMDLERWFPGLKPGDPCASPLNPILWHRDESFIGTV